MATLMIAVCWMGRWGRWLTAAAAVVAMTAACVGVEPTLEPATVELQMVQFPEILPPSTPVAVRGLDRIAEPLWTDYALTDALFWSRDNQAFNRPLIIGVESGETLASVRDLQFPVAPGVRAFYGRRNPDECGWEIGYFGVYGMSASRFLNAPETEFIQMPAPIGNDLTDEGTSALLKYNSLINSAEANVFRTWQEWRPTSGSWLTVDWLAGFRYIGVEESAAINLTCCPPDLVDVPYSVRTRNNLFGGQLGGRARWTWDRWALEGWAKAGILGNAEKQMQAPLVDYLGFQQRPALSSSGSDVGFVGDLTLSVIYRLNDVWGIRAGYSTVWVTGLALAPNQFDFSTDEGAGRRLDSGGGIFLNGANLGLEARW